MPAAPSVSKPEDALPIRYVLNPRARRIGIKVDAARREAVVTAPHPGARAAALSFAQQKTAWIERQLGNLPPARPFLPGRHIPLRGRETQLCADFAGRSGRVELQEAAGEPRLVVGGADLSLFAGRIERALRSFAREDLEARVAVHAAALKVEIAAVSVKDTRGRWGSCASSGRLSFSWRLVAAPPEVLDYVAAHEVAHMIERNHSARFWAIVARLAPAVDQRRAWLRAHGPSLFALGAVR